VLGRRGAGGVGEADGARLAGVGGWPGWAAGRGGRLAGVGAAGVPSAVRGRWRLGRPGRLGFWQVSQVGPPGDARWPRRSEIVIVPDMAHGGESRRMEGT
jgi:hypothetical protein